MIDGGTDRKGCSLRMLVSEALRAYPTSALFEFLEDRDVVVRSAAARKLQLCATREVFNRASQLLKSDRVATREVAAFLLGQLGTPRRPYKGESAGLLMQLLDSEKNTQVRAVAITSLGQLKATDTLDRIIAFSNDRSPSVRASVAFAIGYAYAQRHPRMPSKFVNLVQKLSSDSSRVVRDSAKLALSVIKESK